MAADDPAFLTQDLALQLRDLNRRLRRTPEPPPRTNVWRRTRPPIRAILLEDCVNEGSADCAVTQRDTTTYTQEVSILGDTISGGTFTLKFRASSEDSGQTTAPIPWNATAAQVQAALAALSNVGPGNVQVALGKGSYPTPQNYASTPFTWNVSSNVGIASLFSLEVGSIVYLSTTGTLPSGLSAASPYYVVNAAGAAFQLATSYNGAPVTVTSSGTGVNTISTSPATENPGLWLATFIGKFLQPGVPAPQVMTSTNSITGSGVNVLVEANTIWTDAGVIETLNDIIPVGEPTPMRAGAVAAAIWFPGVGYGIIACECREFSVAPGY